MARLALAAHLGEPVFKVSNVVAEGKEDRVPKLPKRSGNAAALGLESNGRRFVAGNARDMICGHAPDVVGFRFS